MSKMTYLEAMEYVLDSEMEERSELLLLRPGARRAFEEAERDVPLPRMGKSSFVIALGAAMAGMHPVLDLRQEKNCAELLEDAFWELPAGISPAITVIADGEDAGARMEQCGVQVFRPRTPRQAAGFTRAALRSDRMTVVIADQSLYGEEDEVPEEADFMLLPLEDSEASDKADEESDDQIAEEAAYGEAEAEEVPVIEPDRADEEAAYDEAETEPVSIIDPDLLDEALEEPKNVLVRVEEEAEALGGQDKERANAFCATRMVNCDLDRLHSLCGELGMDEELLVRHCTEHVLARHARFELYYDPDALMGEAAFLPPVAEAAALWLGCGVLTISYDPISMNHSQAAALLRDAKRVLENPALLIYDKEYDGI